MIIDKQVAVKITKRNIEHYLQFYPLLKLKDNIYVDIENQLMKGSNQKVNVKCDLCGSDRYINFQMYNRNLNSCLEYKIYTCDKCSHLKIKEFNKKKYGVEYYSQTKEYESKFKNTMVEKYGVEYALQSDELKRKQKDNNLEKYGVENVFQSKDIKDKIKKSNNNKYGCDYTQSVPQFIEKRKKSMSERYGYETSFENGCILRDKAKKTIIDKYGVDSYSKSDIFLEKVKSTNLKKYGVEWIMQSATFRSKSKESFSRRYGVSNISKYELHRANFNISKDPNYIKYLDNSISLFKCDKHEFEIDYYIYNNRKKNNTPLCTVCNPIGDSSSIKEKDLFNFIQESYKGNIIQSYRDELEIDIYLPELKLGFEFNGLYWHSELYKEKNYHLNKINFFKERGIRIIHIWEDDWDFKKDIIKSMLLNILGRCRSIGARKCSIKEVKNDICKSFLNENHIQGWCVSKYRYGLYYNDELVCLMTFGGLRVNLGQEKSIGSYELLRFCNKVNTVINGGASKLLNYFLKNKNLIKVVSYSKNDYSNGNLYNKIGFEFDSFTSVNYYWVIDKLRENRYKWRKDILVKMGENSKLSESQIMKSKGYYKLYDSGNTKWVLTIN